MLPAYLNRIRIRSRRGLAAIRWTSTPGLIHVRFARKKISQSRSSTFTCGHILVRGLTSAGSFAAKLSPRKILSTNTKNTVARIEMKVMLSLSLAGTVGNHIRHHRAFRHMSSAAALTDLVHNDTAYSRLDSGLHGDGVAHAILIWETASLRATMQYLFTRTGSFGAEVIEGRKDWEVFGRHHAMMPIGFLGR